MDGYDANKNKQKYLLSDSSSVIEVSPDLPGVSPTHPPGANEKFRVIVAIAEQSLKMSKRLLSLISLYSACCVRKRGGRREREGWEREFGEDIRQKIGEATAVKVHRGSLTIPFDKRPRHGADRRIYRTKKMRVLGSIILSDIARYRAVETIILSPAEESWVLWLLGRTTG